MRRLLLAGFVIYQAVGLIALLSHPELISGVFYATLEALQ